MDETDAVFKKLLKAWKREQWLLVEALSARATVLDPGVSVGWSLRGKSLYLLGWRKDALASFRKALRLAKGRYRRLVYCDFGHCYEHSHMPNNARKWFTRAIREFPKHASGYIYLADLESSLGRRAVAEKLFQQATQCEEGCIEEAWFNLSVSQAARGELKLAAASLDRALKIDPKYRLALKFKKQVDQLLEKE
ncbi:hypothetical protein BAC2_01495 [uncultured bacterium]|nr:hypothetical protein BAC2_01495 [uncultured bacterium]